MPDPNPYALHALHLRQSMGIVDISPIAPGLYIASRFYPFDPDRVPGAILLDTSSVLDDSEDFAQEIVEHLAQAAWHLIQAGVPVIIECQAGRNRSGIVAARVLVLDRAGPSDAIAAVREARAPALDRSGGALTNVAMTDWLSTLRA